MSEPSVGPVRIDAWAWSVRLYATRSAAANACRAGHVKINGHNVKPAHPVRPGDTVRAVTPGGERIVVVRQLLSKRVGAAIAVTAYEDHTPAAPPAAPGTDWALRDRGAGRPTKRDRRVIDRFRGR